jgi:protein gp37
MLDAPLRWKKPRKIFVNSMSDLFGEFVPDEYIAAVFGVMAAAHQHTFQVLTKRAERLPKWFEWIKEQGEILVEQVGEEPGPLTSAAGSACVMAFNNMRKPKEWLPANVFNRAPMPLPNVHLGVSVEDRKYGLPRIEHLRSVPAVVRFLSIEPLLEDLGTLDLTGIHWVIVGGESGSGARPMDPAWVRSIRDQCVAAGVSFFFKQWGEWAPNITPEAALDFVSPSSMYKAGKKKAGRVLDGRTWDELPRNA